MSGLTPRRTSSGKISAALPSKPTETGCLLSAACAMVASASSSVLACRSRYPVRSRISMRLGWHSTASIDAPAIEARGQNPFAGEAAAVMTSAYLDKCFIGPLHDALAADVDP